MTNKIKQNSFLSQVFLTTKEPCESLAEVLLESGAVSVLEVGPGGGILTEVLLEKGFKVTAVEKDKRWAEKLKKLSSHEHKNLTVICKDILRFDLPSWVAAQKEPVAICGNIPYHISSAITFWTLPVLNSIQIAVYLTQLEFAQRLAAKPANKSYGSLSVYTQLRCAPRFVRKVGKELFSPIPKVDSAIVSLEKKKISFDEVTLKEIEWLTKYLFSKRRKTLKNSLKKVIEFVSLDLDLQQRPEVLSPEDFATIVIDLRKKGVKIPF